MNNIKKVVKTGSLVKFTDAYMSTSEKPEYSNTKLTPIFDKKGRCRYIVSIVNNSTELFHWQYQLQKREKRFREIAEYSKNLMAIVNSFGVITYASPSYERLLGHQIAKLEGESLDDLIHLDDRQKLKKEIKEAVKKGLPLLTRLRFLKKNKESLLCKMTGTPVYNNDGSFKYIVLTAEDISEKAKKQEKMEYLAYHDFLTDIPNRRKFELKLCEALEYWKDKGSNFALFMLDLDHFKEVNDTWGHDIGDMILINFGKILLKNIRSEDTAARLGGDEFAVIIRDMASIEEVNSLARSLQSLLNKISKSLPRDLEIHTSIGIAWTGFYKENTVDSLVKKADVALYEAKKIKGSTRSIHSFRSI